MDTADPRGDAAAFVKAGLSGKAGRSFWRSLEELGNTARFRAWLKAEFPALAPDAQNLDRRSLLQAMGASLALAGLTGCSSETDETALPYVVQPEGETPGIARYYATAVDFCGFAQPVIGKTYSGRPVKLEGNPKHPASRGATDPFAQAALLGLYDPGRSQAPLYLGRPTNWAAWDRFCVDQAEALAGSAGEGFRLLTGRVTSPTLRRQIAALLARWPKARWHMHEPTEESGPAAATRRLFGRPLDLQLALDKAEVVVALDADPLGPGPSQVSNARGWSARRLAAQQGRGESLLLVAEPAPTLTGIAAAQRLSAGASRIAPLCSAIAAGLGGPRHDGELTAAERRFVEAAVRKLGGARGRSLLLAGASHDPAIQALALSVNERLGNLGATLGFIEPVAAMPPGEDPSLKALASDMAAGRVSTLVVLDCDPVATAPAGMAFEAGLARVGTVIHAGLHAGPTAGRSHWHLPIQHALESWTDGRAVDGTVSVVQPLVRPFWSVRSLHTVLDNLFGAQGTDREIVGKTWAAAWGSGFDAKWRAALLDGFVAGSAPSWQVPAALPLPAVPELPAGEGLTLLVRPDPTIWDGRFAENAWLQELPKPVTKTTWGNVVQLSPALAAEMGLANGDEIRLSQGDRTVTGPAWIVPGQERDTLLVTLGGGRTDGIAAGLGLDVTRLLTPTSGWILRDVRLEPTGRKCDVATTQPAHAMDGFDLVKSVSRGELPTLAPLKKSQPGFYPDQQWSSPSWGMAIDLDLCIGCNACVTACQAENNIPVVGRELVAQGREMHWLRVDHYFSGEPEAPEMAFQPVPCMHCEQAPCEMGCPVNAAVHSYDGLNLQVYNRCIGTRTCSSYCPYKVRRFNWFDFTGADAESVKAMRNPEVTVRQRGVMEKCTYCIQRIAAARIAADKEGRAIAEGEVVTACQAACPTSAITFGNVLDPATAVSRRKAEARDYALLEEANTRPRTTYLARIRENDEAEAHG